MPEIYGSRRRVPTKSKLIAGPKRTSPRLRGYDSRWDRISRNYRRKHPFCERCSEDENGRVVWAALVDHKYPVQDGGAVHCGDEGLWSLCESCHGWKLALENYARQTGKMEQIVFWCDNPAHRPLLKGWELK